MTPNGREGSILLLGGSGRIGKLFVETALERGKPLAVGSLASC